MKKNVCMELEKTRSISGGLEGLAHVWGCVYDQEGPRKAEYLLADTEPAQARNES